MLLTPCVFAVKKSVSFSLKPKTRRYGSVMIMLSNEWEDHLFFGTQTLNTPVNFHWLDQFWKHCYWKNSSCHAKMFLLPAAPSLFVARVWNWTDRNYKWLYVALQTQATKGHSIILKTLGAFFCFHFCIFLNVPTSSKSSWGFHSVLSDSSPQYLVVHHYFSVPLVKSPTWELSSRTSVHFLVLVCRSSAAHGLLVGVNGAHTPFVSRVLKQQSLHGCRHYLFTAASMRPAGPRIQAGICRTLCQRFPRVTLLIPLKEKDDHTASASTRRAAHPRKPVARSQRASVSGYICIHIIMWL